MVVVNKKEFHIYDIPLPGLLRFLRKFRLMAFFSVGCPLPYLFFFFNTNSEKNRQMETYLETKYTQQRVLNVIDQCHLSVVYLFHHTLLLFSHDLPQHPQLLYSTPMAPHTRLLSNNNDSDLLKNSGMCPTSRKDYSTQHSTLVGPPC